MVNAQAWLEENYPRGGARSRVEKLDLVNLALEGNLKIDGFNNLQVISVTLNKLNNLSVERLPKLQVLTCNDNQLKSLKIVSCPEINTLQCGGNFLAEVDLSQLTVDKLQVLDLSANNLNLRDLSCFSKFLNLQHLNLQANDGLKGKEFYNRFHGSLGHLKNLTKLNFLCISETDIDSDLEKLPNNLQYIVCSNKFRAEASCATIKSRLDLCTQCRMVGQNSPLLGVFEIFYDYKIWKKWKEGDEGNYDRLKELTKILFPNSNTFDFEELKKEVRKLKLTDLVSQLEIKKSELEKLITSLENKLDEDGKDWLTTLFEAQLELAQNNSTFVTKQIEKAKKNLTKKVEQRELQRLLDKQLEANQLQKQVIDLKLTEKELGSLRVQKAQIEIPPKS